MIKLNKIYKKFGAQTVLDGLDLEIKPGDRIALIGQNGAGKTTLIRTLLGQYTQEGQLMVFGMSPRLERVNVLQHIGFVPQHSPPIQMSVHELIDFTDSLSSAPIIKNTQTIATELELDVAEQADKPFFKLSGGMKQKLLIALALAKQPDLLIMDEPAANLDPAGRKAFFTQLSNLPKKTGMLLSSHRVDELLPLVNRIIEMDCGKIVQDEQIKSSSSNGQLFHCRLQLNNENESILATLTAWQFESEENNFFSGQIAEEDRLRFFTAISHFSNHITQMNLGDR